MKRKRYVSKGTLMLPLLGVALHYRVEGVKQVPNGTNTYLLEIEKEEGSHSSYRIGWGLGPL